MCPLKRRGDGASLASQDAIRERVRQIGHDAVEVFLREKITLLAPDTLLQRLRHEITPRQVGPAPFRAARM